ncbi:MAG: DVU_1557 family redox protein [Chloroflexota bacterium]
MSEYVSPADQEAWDCARCGVPLQLSKVSVAYLGNAFPVDLLKCPSCGMVYVSEALAMGKMLEVEKMLEDK